MNNIKNYITEHTDVLGNEFTIGDWIEFDVKGTTIIGEVTATTDTNITCKSQGFRYPATMTKEEAEKIKQSVKSEYKLNIKRKVYKLDLSTKR